jgi:N-acetylmuramoyl-L-alanine amidase
MRKQSKKVTNRKRESSSPTIQWTWPVGAAIVGVAVVLGCLVMQMLQRVETVQSQLHSLERTAAGLKHDLENSDLKRISLTAQFEKANSKIEELRKAVEISNARDERWQTRLESMQSQLERVRDSAKQSRVEVESEKQIAALGAKLDEVNKERHALRTELQMAHSEAKQLKSDLGSAQAKGFRMGSSLKINLNKLKDVTGKPEGRKIGKVAPEAEPGTEGLRKGSLDAVSPEPRDTTLEPASDGRDYLIRTLVFEASGETEIGKAAVAHVILNRKRSGRWGRKIEDVVTFPWQFEPWMTRKSEIEGLSRTDPRYQKAADIADAVLAGHMPDPTAGATHFLNPVIVRKRRGGSLPSWADSDGQPIGRHVFYCPECDGTKPTRAAALETWESAEAGSEG